jgi:hypothetical protein
VEGGGKEGDNEEEGFGEAVGEGEMGAGHGGVDGDEYGHGGEARRQALLLERLMSP